MLNLDVTLTFDDPLPPFFQSLYGINDMIAALVHVGAVGEFVRLRIK